MNELGVTEVVSSQFSLSHVCNGRYYGDTLTVKQQPVFAAKEQNLD